MNKKKLNISFFFNGQRGLAVYKHLKKNPSYNINNIYLSKKYLDSKIVKHISNYKIINNLSSKKILKELSIIDLGIVAGFPLIFPKKLVNLPKYGLINCHAGLLPKYRGGSPLNWQIINNEKYFGISVLKIAKKIDQGDIIKTKKFLLRKKYNINDLHNKANMSFPNLVEISIKSLINGIKLKKQKKSNSYFPQRNSKHSKINFTNKTYLELYNFVRALQKPYPSPFFIYKNKNIYFKSIKKIKKKLHPGKILYENNKFYLGCKDCSIKITTIN